MNGIKHLCLLTMLFFLQGFREVAFVDSASQYLYSQGNLAKKLNAMIKNYDKKIRPDGPSIHVLVEMKIISFGPIDDVNQEYHLDIFFRQWWWDRNLVGALNESLTMAIDIGDLAWKPDTYFTNAKYSQFSYVTKETMRVIIKPDGSVYYSARINLKVNCDMDFTIFPMDVQMCPLFIESYSYTTQEIHYSWYNSKGYLAATKGVEWLASNGPIFILDNVITHEDISNNTKGAFSKLTVIFHLKRRQGYYVWNVYILSGFLVAITWVTFWIPASSYPARVTVSVTCFLTNVLFMANACEQLPRVSYLKAIDWYLIVNAVFVFLTLSEYVFVLNVSADISWLCLEKIKKITRSAMQLSATEIPMKTLSMPVNEHGPVALDIPVITAEHKIEQQTKPNSNGIFSPTLITPQGNTQEKRYLFTEKKVRACSFPVSVQEVPSRYIHLRSNAPLRRVFSMPGGFTTKVEKDSSSIQVNSSRNSIYYSNSDNNTNDIMESKFETEETEVNLTNCSTFTNKESTTNTINGHKCLKCRHCSVCTHKNNPLDLCYSCRSEDRFWYEKLGRYHIVDYISRLLFPLMYGAFLIGYAKYYKVI